MNRDELEKRNVGENLDALMNLDPRGYGVCRILYAGSRKATGEPLTMHAAQTLVDAVKPGDPVYILTGFVLLPHKVPEMDGMVSSMLLARALVLAFGAKPIIVCPQDSVEAFKKCGNVVGLHVYEDLDTAMELPLSLGVVAFTKDKAKAPAQAKALADKLPSSVQSDTASRLAQIRQSVHAMDQLNAVSIALDGESGRIIPAEAMDALYADLDTYFSIIQTNTTSVLETRTLLINHLGALQALLSQ